MKQLKKDEAMVVAYLLKIPVGTFESLFKTSEISTDILFQLLGAVSSQCLGDKEKCEKAASLLIALGKASNYDMTLMFFEDKESALIKKILASLESHSGKDSKLVSDFKKVYVSVL